MLHIFNPDVAGKYEQGIGKGNKKECRQSSNKM